MGIKGLTSYINRNSDRFYQSYELHDCFVVIDGCSLACQLYSKVSNCYSAFGGDYDKFATTVKNFFSLLKQCNVTPIVLVDGGYETRKLGTVVGRLKETYSKIDYCTPINQATVCIFPLMLMEVFKQTLASLGIKFAQADFEGDAEIAALARYLDCPVLSFDSDFYVYDVKYIPFPSLSLSLSQIKSDGKVKYYLSCEVYDVQHFIANFGGLDKSLLPLMAILLGNDYVPRSVFIRFFDKQGKIPKRMKKVSGQQRKIPMVFEWLRQQTLSSAITKILSRVKKEDRQYIQNLIKLSIEGYNNCPTELVSYLNLKVREADTSVSGPVQQFQCSDELLLDSGVNEETGSTKEAESSDESECSENDEDNETSCDEDAEKVEHHAPNSSNFPPWLRDKFRRGELPTFVSDIYHLHLYFCKAQVEDLTLDDSHTLCFPILQVLCRFLLCNEHETIANDNGYRITCYIRRSRKRSQKIELEASSELPCITSIPPITQLPSVCNSVRRDILYNTLGITSVGDIELVESFGSKWQLFAMVVVFWARSATNPKVTNCHLHAVIISMITLGVIDKKIGRVRHQRDITKRKAKNLQRIQQSFANSESEDKTRECPGVSSDVTNASSGRSLQDILSNVSEADCWNLAEFVLQCNQVNGKLLTNPRQFCTLLVHSLAQLQACLNQAMVLNSILGYPVPQCQISETFSGTVTYMAFSNFNARCNVGVYIKSLMRNSSSVYDVYQALWDRFNSLLPNLTVLFRKSKRKGKRKYSECVVSNPLDRETISDGEPEPILDANNRFSVLGII